MVWAWIGFLVYMMPPAGFSQTQGAGVQPQQQQPQAQPTAEEQERERKRQEEQERLGRQLRPRIFRIEGKILMSGGGAPPDRVPLAVVCQGQVAEKVLSQPSGAFGFNLGSYSGTMTDASAGRAPGQALPAGGPVGEPTLHDCYIHATLLGFRAEPAGLMPLQPAPNVTYVRMILHPVGDVSGHTFSATTASAPKEARRAAEKGHRAFENKKLADAERELRRAVALHPPFATAWYDLGRLLMSTQQRTEAREALERAVAADASYFNPYPVLAQLDLSERRWEDLARHTGMAIRLHPGFSADQYLLSAQANLKLGRLELAERHAREGLSRANAQQRMVAERLVEAILAERRASK